MTDSQIALTCEEALQTLIACYGGEQQLIDALVMSDRDSDSPLTHSQLQRALSY